MTAWVAAATFAAYGRAYRPISALEKSVRVRSSPIAAGALLRRCAHSSSYRCSPRPRTSPASARAWQMLLRKALRCRPGSRAARHRPAVACPTGVIDRRATPTVAARRARHHRHAGGARVKHRPAPARQRQGALQGRLRATTPAASTWCSSTPSTSSSSASCRSAAIRCISGRIEAYNDVKQMAHPDYIVAPEAACRPAAAGAGLSPDRRPVGQGSRARRCARPWIACPSCRMAGAGLAGAAGMARFPCRARRACTARRMQPTSRPASPPWMRLAYDELLAGQLALALVRQSYKSQRGRPITGDGAHPRTHRRCAALRAHQLAAPGPQGDRRGHGRAAPHAAAAAGRRRLGQDGRGADGHGRGRGGGRARRP